MRKVHLYEPLNLFGTSCNGNSLNPKTSLMWEDVDCGSCRKTDAYKYAKSNQIKQEVLEMSSVKKSCQNCVSCIDDKCINVYNESGRIDMFDASHCTRWKDKNNLQVSSVIPELEITLSIKQYDNKAIEFIQALSELTDMYGNYISEANIDDCLNLVKNIQGL